MSEIDFIKVAVRVRPFVPNEIDRGCKAILKKTEGLNQIEVIQDSSSRGQKFNVDNVCMPEDSQVKVYNKCVRPMVAKLFDGYNVTILSYGQTGSGKTHTMGTDFDGEKIKRWDGIIPRALNDIFETVRSMENQYNVRVSCSFLELYEERVFDLIQDGADDAIECDILEDNTKGMVIAGLSEQIVRDINEAFEWLLQGGLYISSRSHALFTVNISLVSIDGYKKNAKFHLVDLAGSVQSKKTQVTGTRLKEGDKINQGLLALENVISALGGGSVSGYISYRDSLLTRLLQDSLGGNSVTLIMACVSPADFNVEETLETLRFANRARNIINKPVRNEDSSAYVNPQPNQEAKNEAPNTQSDLPPPTSEVVTCSCRGTCATKCCKCVKNGSLCSKSCKCRELACANQSDVPKQNNSEGPTTSMQENIPANAEASEKGATRKKLQDITTLYYPRDPKKRCTLLDIP